MEEDLAVFKACSDATRLRILFLLAVRELCVCELVAVMQMPQGKVSRHLAVLKGAGLVSDRRDSTWIYYSLRKADSALKEQLHSYLGTAQLLQVAADRQRLEELSAAGQICAPHAVPASSAALS